VRGGVLGYTAVDPRAIRYEIGKLAGILSTKG